MIMNEDPEAICIWQPGERSDSIKKIRPYLLNKVHVSLFPEWVTYYECNHENEMVNINIRFYEKIWISNMTAVIFL